MTHIIIKLKKANISQDNEARLLIMTQVHNKCKKRKEK